MRSFILYAVFVLAAFALPLQAHASSKKEALVKGAFIYKFVHFYIGWPESKNASNINICTLDAASADHMKVIFDKASQKSAAKNYTLLKLQNADGAAQRCHVLYMGKAQESALPSIIASLANAPVLTVADADNFTVNGGMIELKLKNNKLAIAAINKAQSDKAGINISPELLELAEKIIR